MSERKTFDDYLREIGIEGKNSRLDLLDARMPDSDLIPDLVPRFAYQAYVLQVARGTPEWKKFDDYIHDPTLAEVLNVLKAAWKENDLNHGIPEELITPPAVSRVIPLRYPPVNNATIDGYREAAQGMEDYARHNHLIKYGLVSMSHGFSNDSLARMPFGLEFDAHKSCFRSLQVKFDFVKCEDEPKPVIMWTVGSGKFTVGGKAESGICQTTGMEDLFNRLALHSRSSLDTACITSRVG